MVDLRFGEIKELQQELLELGYYQFQINDLIREAVQTTRLEKLPSSKLVQLVMVLEQYCDFARKCHNN
jgi:hypothetical protein